MRIAVVIPALDEAASIGETVRSASEPGVEVLVVDGGSRDATVALARSAGARVTRSEAGRARQLEAGRRAVTAEVVAFLHADTRLGPGFAAAIRAALRDPRVVGGAFVLRFDRRTPALRVVEWGARLRARLLTLPYGDQGIFARADRLAALGGVPQQPILEDLDLVRALKRHGRFVVIGPPATTSARRYRTEGVLRTVGRNAMALAAWRAGVERARLAAWMRR